MPKIPHPPELRLNKKKKLNSWSDPEIIWPPITPRTIPKKSSKTIKHIEQEEYEKVKLLKNFEYPDFNIGDVVSFHYLHSLSEGRGNTYTGLIISK